jgi:endonuclease-3 related protein
MPSLDESLPALLSALADRYGRPGPAASSAEPFRAVLEAALSSTAGASKVDAALDALDAAGLLVPETLAETEVLEVVEVLRARKISAPAKAAALLQRLARWVVDRHDGDLDSLRDENSTPTSQLRDELLSLSGIGPATADTILLSALRRPVYPVDRATYRILVRHGWLDPWAEYDEARDTIESAARGLEPASLEHLAQWMERLGRDDCKASRPHCESCPLQPLLPDGGPRLPE